MAIVSYEYYTNEFIGEPIAECKFAQYVSTATRAINLLTHGRAAKYAALHPVLQEAIRNAICAQISYYVTNGLEVSVNGNTAGGWTVGKVKVDNGGSSSAGASGGSTMFCASAIAELEQTGLLNPDVPVVGMPPNLPLLGVW
jgi:hypothetical protein